MAKQQVLVPVLTSSQFAVQKTRLK